jgi:hypothetical protein
MREAGGSCILPSLPAVADQRHHWKRNADEAAVFWSTREVARLGLSTPALARGMSVLQG